MTKTQSPKSAALADRDLASLAFEKGAPALITDANGVILHLNHAFSSKTGYAKNELLGRSVMVFESGVHDEDFYGAIWAELKLNGAWRGEICNRRRDGRVDRDELLIHRVPGDNPDRSYYLCTLLRSARQTSSACRRQACVEETLRQEKQRLEAVLAGTQAGTWEWNVKTGEVIFNQRWAEIIGETLESLAPISIQTWLSRVHPDDGLESKARLQRYFAGETDAYDCEARMRHRDGRWVWVLDRGRVTHWDDDGSPLLMAGTHIDVTERNQARERLAESERLYHSLFDNVSDAIFLVAVEPDGGFRFRATNAAHQAISGISGLDGKRPAEVLDAATARAVEENYARCVRERRTTAYEETVSLPAGQRTAATTLTPIFDRSGKVELVVGISRDITASKQLQAELRAARDRLASYFDLAPIGVYVADSTGHYKEVNRAACKQSGFSKDELLAMSIGDYLWPEDLRLGEAHFAELREKGAAVVDLRLRSKEGGYFWGTVLAGLLPDGDAIAFVETITEKVALQDELKRSNAELEQFAYVVSHDLRQPLRMIATHAQLLQRQLGEHLSEKPRRYLSNLHSGALRMDEMLLALLTYSRVGREGEPIQRVASRDLLDEALRYLEPEIHDRRATLTIEGDWPSLSMSPNEGVRLFQNLVGNALKYCPASRSPQVRLSVVPLPGYCQFSISDNGIGIDPSQQDRLFKVFQRLHTRTEYEGTGIGLAVCRRIVERHSGRIWLESAGEGFGTTVRFILPAAQRGDT